MDGFHIARAKQESSGTQRIVESEHPIGWIEWIFPSGTTIPNASCVPFDPSHPAASITNAMNLNCTMLFIKLSRFNMVAHNFRHLLFTPLHPYTLHLHLQP